MTVLERQVRQLLVETGLMAVNHGFFPQAQAVRAALPWLTNNPQVRNILEATLLIGLNESQAAAVMLADDTSPEAEILRQLLQGPGDSPLPAWHYVK